MQYNFVFKIELEITWIAEIVTNKKQTAAKEFALWLIY